MKRILACLLCVLLLAGCGGRETGRGASGDTGETARPETEALEPGAGLVMEMEHVCYDESISRCTYFVRNGTDGTVEFGEDYSLQRQSGGRWESLRFQDGHAFTAIGYCLAPGGTMALTCWPGMFQERLENGVYRLVKQVGEDTLYAEFEIGESPYTAETPYGFGPLEDLPEEYGAGTASDADVVFTLNDMENDGTAEEFLYKVSLGVPCQLRTVQDYGEGAAMVIDTIYENGHFLWRLWNGGAVQAEQRFSYLVTDGADLYLSNGADWENTVGHDSEKAFLLPEGSAAWLVPAVEEMTADRLEGNAARYRVWSADGVWSACLTETPTEFGVSWQREGEGSRGGMYGLQNWDGLETAILDLAWQEDGTLSLTCGTVGGGTSRLVFDPESEGLQTLDCF